jgi:hypothetical protein
MAEKPVTIYNTADVRALHGTVVITCSLDEEGQKRIVITPGLAAQIAKELPRFAQMARSIPVSIEPRTVIQIAAATRKLGAGVL